MKALLAIALIGGLGAAGSTWATEPAALLYQAHCARCHGVERLGGMGPALLPENLGRLKKAEALAVIRDGRALTQMPGFQGLLDDASLQALADYLYTPPATPPRWGLDEIRASHTLAHTPDSLPDKPLHSADPLHLFVVVELGDHHITILDGDRLEPLHRFATRPNLHGGPKFSPDGRYVYLCSRDGWVSKFDLYSLQTVAEIRAGINARNLAVSADGRTVMVANYLPHTLVALSADDLSPLKVIPVDDGQGHTSRVSAVYTAAPRHSFIAALKDLKEVWEIPYNEQAEPVYQGVMHDYRSESGEASLIDRRPLPVRRIAVDDYLDDFFFDPSYQHLIGASRDGGRGQVVNLVVGRPIASVALPGLPHLGSGITWEYQGRSVLATPNLKEGVVSIIDLQSWQTLRRIPTLGPGFFLRSHENSPYAWVDNSFAPGVARETLQLIDKRTLEVVKSLRPAPGKTAAHVEFTHDGRYALVSVADWDGALVVYDAATLEEVKRLPMRKPSGKYNVSNKINRSSGTSH
ncbi:MAG TPA: cytochrome D1 domain-containing protein [Candidatus Competibacteraceae bacterium]|nr:cytochrome D1 domain-containing protein [Candidatus Competibacteraceae bacterium]